MCLTCDLCPHLVLWCLAGGPQHEQVACTMQHLPHVATRHTALGLQPGAGSTSLGPASCSICSHCPAWSKPPELLHLLVLCSWGVLSKHGGLLHNDDEHSMAAAGGLIQLGRASGSLGCSTLHEAIHLHAQASLHLRRCAHKLPQVDIYPKLTCAHQKLETTDSTRCACATPSPPGLAA